MPRTASAAPLWIDPTTEAISWVEILGTFRQLADFVRDNGEAATLFAGSGRFDGGVEGEQVGLVGNVLDHRDDGGDALRCVAQLLDARGCVRHRVCDLRHLGHHILGCISAQRCELAGFPGGVVGVLGIVAEVVDADRHFLDARRHRGGRVVLGGRRCCENPGRP